VRRRQKKKMGVKNTPHFFVLKDIE